MSWIDIVLLIPILWFAYKGFRKGFVIELTTLVALILSVFGALKYSHRMGEVLNKNFNLESEYMPYISFIVTFIGVLVVVHLIGRILQNIVNVAQLGILNKLAGLFFSTMKIVIILSFLVNGFDRLNNSLKLTNQEALDASSLYTPLNQFSLKIYDFVGENFDTFKEKVEEATEEIDNIIL